MQILDYTQQGYFEPDHLAELLRTSKKEIALTIGLDKDALQRKSRVSSAKCQTKLRELSEILNKVEHRFGTKLIAYAWFRSEPLHGFGGKTAMTLVQEGNANQVLDYIDAIDAGVHA